jgi:crotonobetainyl-CoA:carnitine CoA-transferase CaiB-like acyl-CoA transferase
LKVLDFTSVVVGPIATQFLADYGADVIKIEPPGGDLLRVLGGDSQSGQLSPKFLQMNRNKRSLGIDLRTVAGREVVRRLLADCDIVVVNMRRAALVRLGLDAEAVHAINDGAIHCSLTGFGSRGRYHDRAAYDSVIQGAAGIAACNLRARGEALLVPMVLADHLVGLVAVQMILLAVRARDRTNQGQTIEVPMFENVAAFVLQEHIGQRAFIPPRGPSGDLRVLDQNARPIRTLDGYLCVSANTDRQAQALFDAIGRSELKSDPRFATVAARYRNVEEYFAIRNAAFGQKTTADWLDILQAQDVPAMPVNTFESLLEDPHLREVGLLEEVDCPEEGAFIQVGLPNRFSGGRRETCSPAPALGQHGRAILRNAGFSDAEIEALTSSGVVIARDRVDQSEAPDAHNDVAPTRGQET